MIDATKLPRPAAARAAGSPTDEAAVQVASTGAPAGEPTAGGSQAATYPAKNLVLENGRYRVADHGK